MWELVVAGMCSLSCSDVALIDPPDVLCTFNEVRWSIACKMVRSSKAGQHVKRIVEGAQQIESYPAANRGLVLVNVTDALPHNEWSDAQPLSRTQPVFEAAVQEQGLRLDRRDLFDRLSVRPKARSFVVFGQALLDDGEQMTLFSSAIWPKGIPHHAAEDLGEGALIDALNDAGRYLAGRAPI